MPGQGLGRLGRNVSAAQVRDEGVAVRVEVGVEPSVVAAGDQFTSDTAPAEFQ